MSSIDRQYQENTTTTYHRFLELKRHGVVARVVDADGVFHWVDRQRLRGEHELGRYVETRLAEAMKRCVESLADVVEVS